MIKDILDGENNSTKYILEKAREEKKDKWKKQIDTYLNEINIKYEEIKKLKRATIKRKIREWDTANWKRNVDKLEKIDIYKAFKKEIKEEKCYDNRPESNLLFQARTNSLDLNDENRHKKKVEEQDTRCKLCGNEYEDIIHFMIDCKEIEKTRDKQLMKRHQDENKETMIGNILFKQENIEETKIMLGKMWKYRKEKTKEIEKEQEKSGTTAEKGKNETSDHETIEESKERENKVAENKKCKSTKKKEKHKTQTKDKQDKENKRINDKEAPNTTESTPSKISEKRYTNETNVSKKLKHQKQEMLVTYEEEKEIIIYVEEVEILQDNELEIGREITMEHTEEETRINKRKGKAKRKMPDYYYGIS